jgi:MoaA/NifB/PqqE/SkfB family radical SAM enzyme
MLQTSEAVQPFRKRFSNLLVHTLTTVMKENQDEILEIYEELKERFQPDGLSFNYCRGNPLDPSQTQIVQARYEQLIQRMRQDFLDGKLQLRRSGFAAANHLLDQQVRVSVERTVSEQRPQFSCVAGRLAGVIYSNGDVVECEIKNSKLGNLRDVEYDFSKVWFGDKARRIAHEAAHGCYCTHECGHYASTIYSIPKVIQIAGQALRADLTRRLAGRAAPSNAEDAPGVLP